jgi:hypothetical protein
MGEACSMIGKRGTDVLLVEGKEMTRKTKTRVGG